MADFFVRQKYLNHYVDELLFNHNNFFNGFARNKPDRIFIGQRPLLDRLIISGGIDIKPASEFAVYLHDHQ